MTFGYRADNVYSGGKLSKSTCVIIHALNLLEDQQRSVYWISATTYALVVVVTWSGEGDPRGRPPDLFESWNNVKTAYIPHRLTKGGLRSARQVLRAHQSIHGVLLQMLPRHGHLSDLIHIKSAVTIQPPTTSFIITSQLGSS